MKLCGLLKKRKFVLLTIGVLSVGVCLLGGCGYDKAVEADDDIASAAVTDVITVPKTGIVTSSETAEETVPETENDTSSETTEETVTETGIVTSSVTTEETLPETENDTSSETTEETFTETETETSSETAEEIIPETENDTFSETTEEAETETTAENAHTITYVLNTNTKRIHYTDCGSVKKIKPENYDTTDDFDKAISDGFKPCGNCKPHG